MRISYLLSSALLLIVEASRASPSPHPAPALQQQHEQKPLNIVEDSSERLIHTKNDLEHVIDSSPLLSLHRDIVKLESISGNETNAGDYLIRYLQARGFKVKKQVLGAFSYEDGKYNKERFNIYAYPRSIPAPKVLLTSHIDTVPPFIPYGLDLPSAFLNESLIDQRDNIIISGRGSVDAKASIAAQIIATLEYLELNPDASLGLLFVVGEETFGDGMKWFSNSSLNTSPPTFHTVIFGEPTDLALVAGHKGSLGFTLSATGKAAHSGYPWLGSSAVSALLPALAKLDTLDDIPVEDGGLPGSEKLGNTTINIGRIDAGVAGNVVAAAGHALVNLRLGTHEVEKVRDTIIKTIHDTTDGDESVTIEWEKEQAPIDFDTDVEGFDVKTVNYATDAFYLEIHKGSGGRPTGRARRYLYGPGNIFVAHGADEAITVGELEAAVEGYKVLIDAAFERNL